MPHNFRLGNTPSLKKKASSLIAKKFPRMKSPRTKSLKNPSDHLPYHVDFLWEH